MKMWFIVFTYGDEPEVMTIPGYSIIEAINNAGLPYECIISVTSFRS